MFGDTLDCVGVQVLQDLDWSPIAQLDVKELEKLVMFRVGGNLPVSVGGGEEFGSCER